jgi:hypothetical protein
MKALLALSILILLIAVAMIATEAKANIIYDWHGECMQNCTGEAHAEITLPDSYIPGTLFDCDVITIECFGLGIFYEDNVAKFDDGHGVSGVDLRGILQMPVIAGPGMIHLIKEDSSDNRFYFNIDGSWETRFEAHPCCDGFTGYLARGDEGTFARSIPEPSMLALFALGLGLLWRRQL